MTDLEHQNKALRCQRNMALTFTIYTFRNVNTLVKAEMDEKAALSAERNYVRLMAEDLQEQLKKKEDDEITQLEIELAIKRKARAQS